MPASPLHNLLRRGLDRQLRLAVTGLSRAGKTAFITALVHQLQQADASLELLTTAREGRLLGARRVVQSDLDVPRFPYDEALAALYDEPPRWPTPTRGISEIRLAIRYRPQSALRYLNETATLYLELVDYPGEWLLDLPLLAQDFFGWSARTTTLLDGSRRAFAGDWLAAASGLDLLAPADETRLAAIAELYTAFLLRSKEAGFAYIQPGRFVLPGDLEGAPALQFFPLPQLLETDRERLRKAPANSVIATLARRFEFYKNKVVKPFYRDHFARFDRQIVLVDCLGALNRGADAVADMQRALTEILGNFRYGKRDLLRRLFAPRIDRLVFAASKADHVTPEQHPRLLQLLRNLLQQAEQIPRYDAVRITSLCLASINATRAVEVVDRDGNHPALRGHTLAGEAITLFPGDVPSRVPDAGFWRDHHFEFTDFRPLAAEREQPLPHIRMDQALEALLGDKLR
jgi:predicted YcjX-like family ATPase